MEIFHEGLPGSGKSYEAMVRHIIPALLKGREVFAYIEGINHERVAEAAGLSVEHVQKLLHQITREQVKEIYKHVRDNSLVVLDEAQNFWPVRRIPLSEQMTQFVTEHRHRGIDLLLMGQDMRDVHATWRRRVSQKVVLNKLDAVGAEGRYSYVVYKATAPEKFAKVSSGITSYDAKYFGTYASHVSDETNTQNYKDARANVLNVWWVKWGLPVAIVGALWGLWTAYKFFSPEVAVKGPAASASAPPAPVVAQAPLKAPQVRGFIEDLNSRYRPRLGLLHEHGGKVVGMVEWWDGDRLRERLTFHEIAVIGTEVEIRGGLVRLGGTWVTPWPVERSGAAQQAVPIGSVAAIGGSR